MNIHKNARLTPWGREELARRVLEHGMPVSVAAVVFGVSSKTASKWVSRFRTEGAKGLWDRSSRPARFRRPTCASVVANIIALRRQRLTGKHIAMETGVSPATVSRVLKRAGLSRLRDLEPAEPE